MASRVSPFVSLKSLAKLQTQRKASRNTLGSRKDCQLSLSEVKVFVLDTEHIAGGDTRRVEEQDDHL